MVARPLHTDARHTASQAGLRGTRNVCSRGASRARTGLRNRLGAAINGTALATPDRHPSAGHLPKTASSCYLGVVPESRRHLRGLGSQSGAPQRARRRQTS